MDGTGKSGKQKPGKRKSAKKVKPILWIDLFRCFLCQKEGRSPPLRKCSQCEIAYYCSKTCQRAHWKIHKPACVHAVAAKADDARRERLARAVRAKGKEKVEDGEDDALCVICLGPPVDPVELPCGHEYCRSCMAQLREKQVAQTCPLCRKPLPPGPDKLFDLGYRTYAKIQAAVQKNSHVLLEPAYSESWETFEAESSWENICLSSAQQREMDQSRALLLEAAAQGHVGAQSVCGAIYRLAQGVARDDRLMFSYTEKAARQGDKRCQHMMGVYYRKGEGCKQSNGQAVEWFEKSARQNHPNSTLLLGFFYYQGHAVPRSYERAAELFKKATALGDEGGRFMLGVCHEGGTGVAKDYGEARRLYKLASAQGLYLPPEKLKGRMIATEEKIRTECPFLDRRVLTTGTSREDLNGRAGVATSFDHSRGRYVVQLDGDAMRRGS